MYKATKFAENKIETMSNCVWPCEGNHTVWFANVASPRMIFITSMNVSKYTLVLWLVHLLSEFNIMLHQLTLIFSIRQIRVCISGQIKCYELKLKRIWWERTKYSKHPWDAFIYIDSTNTSPRSCAQVFNFPHGLLALPLSLSHLCETTIQRTCSNTFRWTWKRCPWFDPLAVRVYSQV